MRRLAPGVMNSLGLLDGSLYLFDRGLSRLTRGRCRLIKYHFVVQPLSALDLPTHRGKGIEIREIGPDDPLRGELVRPERVIHLRYEQGARCLAAYRRGELAGFLWYVAGPYQEDVVRCLFVPVPEDKAVWDFDVYVEPRHRISPVFLRLWQEASRDLLRQGYTHTCSRIAAYNPGSLSSHQRLGGERAGWGLYLLAGRAQLAFFGSSPWVHVSFRKGSFPVVRVGP